MRYFRIPILLAVASVVVLCLGWVDVNRIVPTTTYTRLFLTSSNSVMATAFLGVSAVTNYNTNQFEATTNAVSIKNGANVTNLASYWPARTGGILFAGAGGLTDADTNRLTWDTTNKVLWIGGRIWTTNDLLASTGTVTYLQVTGRVLSQLVSTNDILSATNLTDYLTATNAFVFQTTNVWWKTVSVVTGVGFEVDGGGFVTNVLVTNATVEYLGK